MQNAAGVTKPGRLITPNTVGIDPGGLRRNIWADRHQTARQLIGYLKAIEVDVAAHTYQQRIGKFDQWRYHQLIAPTTI